MRKFVPYKPRLTGRAQRLRRDAPPAERKLWYEYLRYLPEKFTRQKPLGSYVVDFYCAQRRLVIELDGDSHFANGADRYDERRTEKLAALGVRVLRLSNKEVMEGFEGVCLHIERVLKA